MVSAGRRARTVLDWVVLRRPVDLFACGSEEHAYRGDTGRQSLSHTSPAILWPRFPTPSLCSNAAFNLEPHCRKRFVVSMANRTRWPVKPRLTGIKKKLQ